MVFAYIDPGSGSMLIQVLIAGALAVPFFFRNAIAGVVRRVRGGRDQAEADTGRNRSEGS